MSPPDGHVIIREEWVWAPIAQKYTVIYIHDEKCPKCVTTG